MKKIDCYFIHLYNDFSGSPRVFKDFIDSIASEKYVSSVNVLTSRHQGFLTNKKYNNINVFYKIGLSKTLKLFYFLLFQISLFFKLYSCLIKNKLSDRGAIIFVNTMLPFSSAFAARIFGVKVIYYIHETSISPQLLKKFLRFNIKSFASNIIYVSNYLADAEPFDNVNSFVLHNGLRNDFLLGENFNLDFKFKNRNILFVGSLKKYKGIEIFVNLAKILSNFKFTAALNCEKNEFKSYVNSNGFPNNLELLHKPPNLSRLYAEAFTVVNLSLVEEWIETFGLSILEGMSYGTPVIVPCVGGQLDYVTDECGLIIDSTKIDEICCYLTELSNSYDRWLLCSNTCAAISANYSSQSYTQNAQKLFKLLTSDSET